MSCEGDLNFQGIIIEQSYRNPEFLTIQELSWMTDEPIDEPFVIDESGSFLVSFSCKEAMLLFVKRTFDIEDKLCAIELEAIDAAITSVRH